MTDSEFKKISDDLAVNFIKQRQHRAGSNTEETLQLREEGKHLFVKFKHEQLRRMLSKKRPPTQFSAPNLSGKRGGYKRGTEPS